MIERIYIAGPMRGYPQFNFPAFDEAAAQIRARGHHAVNPADLDRAIGFDGTGPVPLNFLRVAIARDVQALCECSAIFLLPRWRESEGALTEYDIALMLRLKMYFHISEVPDARRPDEAPLGRAD